jgi:hypothetical protein
MNIFYLIELKSVFLQKQFDPVWPEAANQPATAHLDPATLIVIVAHLHISMLRMSARN